MVEYDVDRGMDAGDVLVRLFGCSLTHTNYLIHQSIYLIDCAYSVHILLFVAYSRSSQYFKENSNFHVHYKFQESIKTRYRYFTI